MGGRFAAAYLTLEKGAWASTVKVPRFKVVQPNVLQNNSTKNRLKSYHFYALDHQN